MLTQQNNALTSVLNGAMEILGVSSIAEILPAIQALQDQLVGEQPNSLQSHFQALFRDPDFVIPGETLLEKYHNLMTAIMNLNRGRKLGLYVNLIDLGG